MKTPFRVNIWLFCFALCLISGCALPRGAALKSEILKGQHDEKRDFAVYPVNRTNLAVFDSWAFPDQRRRWISNKHSKNANTIRTGDIISITIWDSDENSLLAPPEQARTEMPKLRVSESGTIFLPFVGEIKISGLTESEARREVQKQVEAAIPSAQVQLTLAPGPEQTVDLVGGVVHPGPVVISKPRFSVLNLISKAGGVRGNVNNPQVILVRNEKRYEISLHKLYENATLDRVLRRGDKVIIEPDKRYYRALGATGGDNIYHFEKDVVTALDTLAQIGGLSDQRANLQGILIMRNYPSSAVRADGTGPSHARSIFVIDLTSADGTFSAGKFRIAPKDTVLVTESPVNSVRTILGLIGATVGIAK